MAGSGGKWPDGKNAEYDKQEPLVLQYGAYTYGNPTGFTITKFKIYASRTQHESA